MKGRPCCCGKCTLYIYAPSIRRKYHRLCQWNPENDWRKYQTAKPRDVPPEDISPDEIKRIYQQHLAVMRAKRRAA
jgi:hypothetical protein